jgi:hypothetical protein
MSLRTFSWIPRARYWSLEAPSRAIFGHLFGVHQAAAGSQLCRENRFHGIVADFATYFNISVAALAVDSTGAVYLIGQGSAGEFDVNGPVIASKLDSTR